MLRSRRCSLMRSRIWACTVTSSAVVGSSANSMVGPQAMAMAIITRWRMPPDSSCGYWSRRRSASGMRTSVSSRLAVALASSRPMPRWLRSGSSICRPIFISGFSDVIGSWKIIAISLPHTPRMSFGARPRMSCPSKRTAPPRWVPRRGTRPMMVRDSTVLPEPDSPTTPSALPRSSENVTPSTARTTPRGVVKWVWRFSTSMSVPPPWRPAVCSWALTAQPPGCRSGGRSGHR